MANWPFTWFNLADNALGQLAAPQTVRDAKKQLMTIFCRNLPSNLQLTRISFKELT